MANISNKDWERLSAYLDGEVNQKEKKQIEDRIQADPGFQAALEELQTARQVLRAAPSIKVPRNFRLTPDMVGRKPRSRSFQFYRLAAATLTFLFVGVVVMDFGRSLSGVAFAPAAPQESMFEAVPEAAMDAVEEPALMAEESEVEKADRAVEESPPAEAEEAMQPAPDVAAEAADEALGLTEEGEAKAVTEPGAETAANQVEEDSAQAPDEEMAAEPQAAATETLIPPQTQPAATEPPEPTLEPDIKEEVDVDTWEEPAPMSRGFNIDLIRILRYIFGIGAVLLWILAWTRRRRR